MCAGRDAQQPGGGAGPAPGEPAPPGGAPEARRQGKRSGRSRVRSLLQENQHLQEELQKLAANMRVLSRWPRVRFLVQENQHLL